MIQPNSLTVSRIFLTVFFVLFMLKEGLVFKLVAVVIFAIASLTDYFDGQLAKKHNLVTDFGKIMDPIADKFLILSAFSIFAYMEIVPLWMVLLIAFREIGITFMRLVAMQKGKVLAAEQAGKIKTVAQLAAIMVILVYICLFELNKDTVAIGQELLGSIQWGIIGLMWLVLFLTLYSGFRYLWSNRESGGKFSFVKLFSTFFYVGYFPKAPGSLASLAGLLVYLLIYPSMTIYVATLIIVLVAGFAASGKMEASLGSHDPSCVVIDEVAGMLIAVFLLPTDWPVMLGAYAFFRAFDIFKVFPAGLIERQKGSLGIMGDDLIAGSYANIIMHFILNKMSV